MHTLDPAAPVHPPHCWVLVFVLILGIADIVVCEEPPSPPAPNQDTVASLPSEHLDWLEEYRGTIRIWKCDWALDQQDVVLPGAVALRIYDYHFADDGMEQWSITWKQPFRSDLTPDLQYLRVTESSTIEVNGNSRGPRAVIFPGTAQARRKAAPHQILARPVEHFLGRESSRALRDMYWIQSKSGAMTSAETPAPFDAYSGELLTTGAQWRKIRAVLLTRPQATPGNDEPSARLLDRVQPCAIDIAADLIGPEDRQWDGTFAASYRVLDWQSSPAGTSISAAPWAHFPKLVLADEAVSRPAASGKSYHRLSLELLEFLPDDARTLQADWEELLPQMRIADLKKGTARLNAVTERDACAAWQFLRDLSQSAEPFIALLTSDLRTRFSDSLHPIHVTVAPADSSPQIVTGLGTLGRSTVYCALPLVDQHMARSRAVAQERARTGTTPLPAPVLLLDLVDGIRAVTQDPRSKPKPPPVRRGNQPVTEAEKRLAREHLSLGLFGLAIAAGLGTVALLLQSRRRKALTRPLQCVLGFGATLLLDATVARAEPPSASQARREAIVWKIVDDQWRPFSSFLPDREAAQVRERLQADHQELLRRWNTQSQPPSPPTFEPWIRLLNDYYSGISSEVPPHARGPTDPVIDAEPHHQPSEEGRGLELKDFSVRTCATLSTALIDRRTNCYAIALLYHLQCRLAGVDSCLVVRPGHVLLGTRVEADPPKLDLIYDAIRRVWLSPADRDELCRGVWSVLNDEQYPAILAFNLGTTFARQGSLDQAVLCLETAVDRGFPFPDAVKNLCLTYWHQQRYDAIVECCRDSKRLPRITADGRAFDSLPDSRQTLHEIDELHARALTALGQPQAALDLLEPRLTRDKGVLNFRLYRTYVEIKQSARRIP